MTIEQILNSDTESTVTNFHMASNGLLASGEYKGRRVLISKIDIGYIVTITNPDMQFFSTEATQAVEEIKDELGDGRRLKSNSDKHEENPKKPKDNLIRAPRIKERRILVVEDQDDEHNPLSPMLGEYDVVAASDYDEGMRMARNQYFDLYVLDNRMPGGTGIELCRRIREFDPNTPILFCSRRSNPVDRSEALSAGAQAYFVKPIEVQEVLGTVTKLFSASSQRLYEARQAEYVAIREELAVRFRENRESVAMAAERTQRAVRKLLRLKARKAFLNAGGARGDFARLWPTAYLDAALNWESSKRKRSN